MQVCAINGGFYLTRKWSWTILVVLLSGVAPQEAPQGDGTLDLLFIVNNIEDISQHKAGIVQYVTQVLAGVELSRDAVMVAASYVDFGRRHTDSSAALTKFLRNKMNRNSGEKAHFESARNRLRRGRNEMPRDYSPDCAVYISQGLTNKNAGYVHDSIHPLVDRFLVVGTDGADWDNLQQYALDPDDMFTMDTVDDVLRVLHCMINATSCAAIGSTSTTHGITSTMTPTTTTPATTTSPATSTMTPTTTTPATTTSPATSTMTPTTTTPATTTSTTTSTMTPATTTPATTTSPAAGTTSTTNGITSTPSAITTTPVTTTNGITSTPSPITTTLVTTTPSVPSSGVLDILLIVNNINDTSTHKTEVMQFVTQLLDGLDLSYDAVLVGLSIVNNGRGHTDSRPTILGTLSDWFTNDPSLGTAFANARYHLTATRNRVSRDYAPHVAIYISEGYTSEQADYVLESIEPAADRFLVVGTNDANWNNLNQYNSHTEDRFTTREVTDVLQVLYCIMGGRRCDTGGSVLDILLIVNNINDTSTHVNDVTQFVTQLLDGLDLSYDAVLVGISIVNNGRGHTDSRPTILSTLSYRFTNDPSLDTAFANARYHLTATRNRVPRDYAPHVAIYISQGYTSEQADYVLESIEPAADRFLVVGTNDANWTNLNQYNSHTEDRFTTGEVAAVLQVLYCVMNNDNCNNGITSIANGITTTPSSSTAVITTTESIPSTGTLDVILIVNNIDNITLHIDAITAFVTQLLDGLELSMQKVIVGASYVNNGRYHTDSAGSIISFLTNNMANQEADRAHFGNSRHHLTHPWNDVPRDYAPDCAIYISQGLTNDLVDYVHESIEPLLDRFLIVGTDDANWDNLNQYNSNPNDQFTMDHLDNILHILHSIQYPSSSAPALAASASTPALAASASTPALAASASTPTPAS